ncbi:MAG: pyridoxamine 5'-phosphate oxidase family protein [Vulcanibacillus sp.]
MFQKLRREDRKMEDLETIKLLESGNFGVLSTINENGYPYGVPLSYVYLNKNIYFHSAMRGNKISNILINNKVSFCIVGESTPLPEEFSMSYKSVIVFGKADEVDGEEKKEALLGLVAKYSSQFIENGKKYIENDEHTTKVIKLNIEHICGKKRD